MRQSSIGSGQDPYQRRLWWIAAIGFMLLFAGAMLMTIVLVVAARGSGHVSLPGTGERAPANVANVESASLPADSLNDHSQDDLAPGVFPPEWAARQALADGSARLVIEAIDVDAPIQPVGLQGMQTDGQPFSQWQVPDEYAVGWHRTSAGLGSPGNTVLNGHNNVHGAVFRDLHQLDYGEEIIIEHDQQTHRYQVSHRELLDESDQPLSVRQENAKWMAMTADERLTLISCWPYVGNTQRIIVIATPTDGDHG